MTSLYDEVGREAGVRRVLQALYDRLFDDAIVGFLFQGKDKPRIVERQVEFTCAFFGGPNRYRGSPLPEAHASLPLLPGHFDRRHRVLGQVLEELGVAPEVRAAWLRLDEGLRSSVIAAGVDARAKTRRSGRAESTGARRAKMALGLAMTVAETPAKHEGERSMSGDDHLATTRLPSIAVGPLPPARVPPSHPPPPHVAPATPSGSLPAPSSPPVPAFAPAASLSATPRVEGARVPTAAPWWRALAASVLGPASTVAGAERVRAPVAVTCAAFGVASIVLALAVGFRAAPNELLMPSAVAASIVIARALMAVGLLGTGLALLRAAERLYFA